MRTAEPPAIKPDGLHVSVAPGDYGVLIAAYGSSLSPLLIYSCGLAQAEYLLEDLFNAVARIKLRIERDKAAAQAAAAQPKAEPTP